MHTKSLDPKSKKVLVKSDVKTLRHKKLVSKDDLKKKAELISKLLKEEFPVVEIPLNHKNAFELLIATILSAQTTDAGVNKVTPELFAKYPTPKDLAEADLEDLKRILRSIGFYNTKANNIKKTAQKLLDNFNGEVPNTLADLITLHGVARKVATVVLWQWFGINEGFTVDTHVLRLSKWFGLSEHKDPVKVERDLMQLFHQDEWGITSLRLILLGRKTLTARSPKHKGTVWEDLVEI